MKQLSFSADLGKQFAQYALGKIYPAGENVPQDITKAVAQFRQAADREKQYTLGKL